MKAFCVDVNPNILVWAREEAGYQAPEIAEYLNTDDATVSQWERDGKSVRYSDLSKLAKKYKRQVPVFFLKQTPQRVKKPNDYRNLNINSKGLHPDTLLAIRRTSRYLEFYKDLSDKSIIEEQYSWLDNVRDPAIATADYIRQILEVPISEQRKKKNQTFNFWRTKFEEKLGIFVFQFPIKDGDFDGFSYMDNGKPYAVTVNNKITEKRKVFTLFHELGHIIEGDAGLCLTIERNSSTFMGIESKCNTFAAQFLMPKSEVQKPSTFEEVGKFADSLGVSKEAYLIRTKSLGLISDGDFNQYMAILRQINAKIKKKPKSGFAIPRDVVSRSQRGDRFFDFVVDTYQANKVSPTIVRDLLDMKVVGLGRSQE